MAEQEPRSNNFFTDNYHAIVDSLVREATPGEKKIWQRGGTELSGFHGELGKQIADWHAEGLGRMLGLPDHGVTKGGETHPGTYKGLMYSLLLRGETKKHKDMVVLFTPDGDDYHVVLGRPLTFAEGDLKKFREVHTQTLEPYIYRGRWNPPQGEKPYHTIMKHQEEFFTKFMIEPQSDRVRNQVIKTAEASARAMKKQRDEEAARWERPEAA